MKAPPLGWRLNLGLAVLSIASATALCQPGDDVERLLRHPRRSNRPVVNGHIAEHLTQQRAKHSLFERVRASSEQLHLKSEPMNVKRF
jgi:hypothetical protein